MEWILVIHKDRDFADAAADSVAEALGMTTVCAYNLESAEQKLRDAGLSSCKLIVSSLSAPANDQISTPVDRDAPVAIDFLNKVRGGGVHPPCVFIASTAGGERARQLCSLKNVELLGAASFHKVIGSVARSLVFGDDGAPALSQPLDVTISLTGAVGRWRVHHATRAINEGGELLISDTDLKDLLFESALVAAIRRDAGSVTAELILRHGQHLYQCLVRRELENYIFSFTDGWNSRQTIRLQFEVSSATSALYVEALARPPAGQQGVQDLWMLRTPIFRKFMDRSGRPPLFKDRASRERRLHCLIIQGTISQFNASGAVTQSFQPLFSAKKEVDWLEGYLAEHRERLGLEPAVVLRASDHAPGEFSAAVSKALTSRTWHLVHYSGHSAIGVDEQPYLVLGPDANDLLDIDLFARDAAGAQFVFLNSCSSANAKFIMRLVDRNIPAVAGYAWPIPDPVAARFAQRFYLRLFPSKGKQTRGFLEYAFMDAKNFLYKTHTRETLWTAPILFMQSLDADVQRPMSTMGEVP